MEKQINEMKINELKNENNNLIVDISFDLVYKNSFKILDRTLTQDKINIQYNSETDVYPRVNITTLKGPTIHGFNLKKRHIEEIKKLLDNSNKEELKKLKDKL